MLCLDISHDVLYEEMILMSTIIRNEPYIPHQAIVMTNKRNLWDFSLKKVGMAYQMRKDVIGTERAIWEIEIHPTNLCNLHCNGCSYGTRHDGSMLTIEQVKRILPRYLIYSPKSIFFSGGGDPLLWDSFGAFFDLYSKVSMFGISTNMYNFKSIKDFWTLIDFYQIHVTGYDDQTVRDATGVNCFSKIDENITYILKNKRPFQTITIKVVIDSENYLSLSNYLDYAIRNGVDSIVLKYQQDFLQDINLATDEILNHIRHEVYHHPGANTYDYIIDNLDDVIFDYPCPDSCLFANSGLYRMINAKGEVYPCIAANINNSTVGLRDTNEDDIFSKNMRERKCPLRACRHYRFSQYLFSIREINNCEGKGNTNSFLL